MSHPKYKLRGYMYMIVEIFPVEEGNGFKELHVYDRLDDAEVVMAALESVNYNFTCYGIMLRPVWEQEVQKPEPECEHSGSTTTLSTEGDFTFHCPKCGETWKTNRDAIGNLQFETLKFWNPKK